MSQTKCMSIAEREQFTEEWDKAVRRLKNSGVDLSTKLIYIDSDRDGRSGRIAKLDGAILTG